MSAILVTTQDSFAVLRKTLDSSNRDGRNVYVLNCADGNLPCAGQFDKNGEPIGDSFEARLFRSTTLALRLGEQIAHKKVQYPFGETVVATPDCEMLAPGAKLPPATTADGLPPPPPATLPGEFTVISAAAPVRPQYDYFGHSPPVPVGADVVGQIERQIMMALLWAHGGILIVPAWGAARLNPPSYTATVWARAIEKATSTSKPELVVFCLPDSAAPEDAPEGSENEWDAFRAFTGSFPASKN